MGGGEGVCICKQRMRFTDIALVDVTGTIYGNLELSFLTMTGLF